MALPVDCVLGQSCYIQQYMDHDPTAAVADFAYGDLAYDGHRGTDFALPDLFAMESGVTVTAVAKATVVGVRDDVTDKIYTAEADLHGQDCGNGVLLDHGEGWQTQYCHLRSGSLKVHVGDQVEQGAPLGLIGLSGRTQFPHLHLAVRRDGLDVDPFAPSGGATCDQTNAHGTAVENFVAQSLWREPIPYQPAGLISVGLTVDTPDYQSLRQGGAAEALISRARQIHLVAYGWGFRAGDQLVFDLLGPDDFAINATQVLDKDQAIAMRYIGKRFAKAGLPAGRYNARVTLTREGETLASRSLTAVAQ
ncbi:M23 family metallopeptidase [Albirhodobacter sp. R86504]|uniref:M23 family metallopeptidase n=1 Tax=Albirhodobacter sp. R86504 TaxID=3093848 RepID=UPI0036711006